MHGRIDFVGWNLREDFQLGHLEKWLGRRVDERVILFQKTIEPAESVNAQFLRVPMRTFGDVQAQLVGSAQ